MVLTYKMWSEHTENVGSASRTCTALTQAKYTSHRAVQSVISVLLHEKEIRV
jgi:hypothetical protein